MEIHLISLLLIFCSLRAIDCRKCLNEYRSWISVIKYGRPASVSPDREVYYPEDVVLFMCPKGFHFESLDYRAHKQMWIKCLRDYRWLEHWPICRGPLENVTCENQYQTAESLGKHWLNQTVNEFHAIYSPSLTRYPYQQHLRFECPKGSSIFRARGLTVMTTMCNEKGEWTNGWPMCKGRTCQTIAVKNAIINDKNKKLSVGVTLDIKCKPGYYLWGPNQTTCLDNLEWSGYPQECVKLNKFRRNCKADNRVMKMKAVNNVKQPYCYSGEVIRHASNHHKIALGISIPIAIGFVIFIVAASFYVKHQRVKMTRERAAYIRNGNQHSLLLSSLPTYADVLKSKPLPPPPSFEETFGLFPHEHEREMAIPTTCLLRSSAIPIVHMVEAPPEYTEVPESQPTSQSPPEYAETSRESEDSSLGEIEHQGGSTTLDVHTESADTIPAESRTLDLHIEPAESEPAESRMLDLHTESEGSEHAESRTLELHTEPAENELLESRTLDLHTAPVDGEPAVEVSPANAAGNPVPSSSDHCG